MNKKTKLTFSLQLFVVMLSLIVLPFEAVASRCGDPRQVGHSIDSFIDNSKKARHHLSLVERVHYVKYVKMLNSLNLTKNKIYEISDNLDYTLRHFPNHHGALFAISELERRIGKELPQDNFIGKGDWYRSSECYFDRALQYVSDDPNVYLIYAIHLHKSGELDKALENYMFSEKLAPNSAELQYNIGLLYFDKKDYKKSKAYAKIIYDQGFKLPGLKNKLKRVNFWP